MGSGHSSNVERIQLEQDDNSSKETKRKIQTKNVVNSQKIDSTRDKETDAGESEDSEVQVLTKQLCESESLRLDLEDKVEALMKELDDATAQNIKDEDKPCNETVHAKDQYIANLEKEKKDLETETHKLKLRQKRKQKQFNTQMAEYKQEVNFEMMELREEINKLKTEKKKLTDTDVDEEVASQKLPGGEKMALILELSNQVTEQGDKISKLEKKLKEKDQIISEMRAKMKNNSEYLSVLNDKPANKTNQKLSAGDLNRNQSNNSSKHNVNTRLIGVAAANSVNVQRDPGKYKHENEIDKLFTLDEEDSDNEDASLGKLSSLLKGTKAKNDKIRLSTDSCDALQSSSPGDRQLRGIPEDTEGHTGRDSGLGSAGKREDEVKQFVVDAYDNVRDWKDSTPTMESGSGLSDSDFEAFPFSQSKVSSAPPKLQNSGGVRLKKKSNSLRKHASSKRDRPPKPGEAFVNSTSSFNSDDHIINILTPIISRVEVS